MAADYHPQYTSDMVLRDAMRKIVAHARAERNSSDRMTKEELMTQIDILDVAASDTDWTVYYP